MGTSNHKKRTWDASTMNREFEGADFLLDMEVNFPKKKWHMREAFYKENSKADANYVTFLEDFQVFWNAKCLDDDDDPLYMLFLENLKEHENAYVCNVSVENGVLSPIIYEEMSQSPNEVKRKTARMSIDNHSRKKWSLKQDGNIKTVRKNSGEENHSRDDLKKNLDVAHNRKSCMKNSDLGNDHSDGVNGRRRTPVSSRDDCVRENRSLDIDGDEESGPKYSGFGKKSETDEAFAVFLDSLHVKGDRVIFECGEQHRVYYETSKYRATDIEVGPLETNTRPLTSSLRPPTSVPRPPTPPPRAQLSTPKGPTRGDATNTLTASKNKAQENKEQLKETISSYQRDLQDYLRQPYDKAEYDNLLELMTARKPVYIHRESRSGGSDRLGHMGKSYLDQYPDLKREIDKVKTDRRKVLNLLRMFKIYLQKIPLLPSRYIAPWKDDNFKTILPG